jgi:DUF1680 family protein
MQMKSGIIRWIFGVFLMSTSASEAQLANLQPVPCTAVQVEPRSFWGKYIQLASEKIAPHNLLQLELTGRIRNFGVAAGTRSGTFHGIYFNDSDVYKVLEGVAYCLAHRRDAKLEAEADDIIDQIAAAQQRDGYLYTYYTARHELDKRWSNEKDMHETYCAGHLIEAAIAYEQATGKRKLLDVAIKLADHIDSVFGPGKKRDVPGHEEIELALIKLYRKTGNERYLKLAQFFIEQRGHSEGRTSGKDYDQDHLPIREQHEIVGHAVRAMYLYCAVADLASITLEQALVDSLDSIWHDVVDRKMYITGGIGPSAKNEGFTVPYDLPNDSAYAETCAAIGMALWNQRMCLLHADAKYADIVEREAYNGLISGVALDGEKYFYVNPLASKGNHHRQKWFDCACCPPNVLRWLPVFGGTAYALSESADDVYVNQFVPGVATVGDSLKITQTTNYPWDEAVKLNIEPSQTRQFALHLRIPVWCESAAIKINGGDVTLGKSSGYAVIRREWKSGDTVELNLAMPVRRIHADPRVKDDVGRVALMRGPIVYCLEGVDQKQSNAGRVRNLVLPRDAQVRAEHHSDLLGGVTVITGKAKAVTSDDASTDREVDFTAVPYYAWDNRDAGEMVVWLPEDRSLAQR